jgi:ABC-type transport system involved in multi-copper enzyme maturation permease subunit
MLLSKRILLTLLLLAAPCAIVLLVRIAAPAPEHIGELWEPYHLIAHLMLMSGLIPLVCIVHGTAMIGSEVEARTIIYLTTRRPRRVWVLLARFAAAALVLTVLCEAGMLILHLSFFAGVDVSSLPVVRGLEDWSPAHDLRVYLAVIPVAVVCFLAVFSLVGLLTARPLAVSVFYLVVIELILGNIPAKVAAYSVSFHLRTALVGAIPRIVDLYELPDSVRDQLYPLGATAAPELCGIILVCLILAGLLVTFRELVPAKITRE